MEGGMKDRILMGLALAMTVAPAIAGVTDSIRVPEPATMTLFGAAVVGGYVVRKIRNRK
jgi:hypothetical protein